MKKFFVVFGLAFVCITAFAHSVEWYVGSSLYQTTTCNSGDNITPPVAPTKYGYSFAGWKAPYTKLEYIESTGAQYIDTGITPRATKLQVNFKMQSLTNEYQSFFGAVDTPSRIGYRVYRQESTSLFYFQAGTGYHSVVTNLNNPIECQTTINNGGDATFVVNGMTTSVDGNFNTQFDTNMMIFTSSFGNNGSITGTGAFKLWSFQIIKDDEEKFNGVPARRNSDNVLGVYDTVSQTFFTNAGTGEFIAGPEVGNLQ